MYFLVYIKIFEDFKQHDRLSFVEAVCFASTFCTPSFAFSLFFTCSNICPTHFRKC